MLPIQLVGVMVGLFGVGYLMVAANPVENRNLLMLGFWSKALGSALGIGYVVLGKLPLMFLPILFFADIVYLPPFAIIVRRLNAIARERRAFAARRQPRRRQWADDARSLHGCLDAVSFGRAKLLLSRLSSDITTTTQRPRRTGWHVPTSSRRARRVVVVKRRSWRR